MTRLSKAYAAFLLAGVLLIAGPEALPRPSRGFARADLARTMRVAISQWDEAARRLAAGNPRTGDDELQLLNAPRLREARQELWIRDGQTLAVLLMAAASVVFAIRSAPGAIRWRRGAPGGGEIEVMADESRTIGDDELPARAKELVASRREAIAKLFPERRRCAYCGRTTRWKALGRIGKRTLLKRPPEGAKNLRVKIGEGWWWRAAPHSPCAKCGSIESVAA